MLSLGIDTSNYTTSAALYDGTGWKAERLLLPVGEGKLGLRQSDAVFLHVKQLPGLLESLLSQATEPVTAIGVSTRPRDAEGSYMPCFLAGEMAARSIGGALGLPWQGFSHQAGHLAAALLGAEALELMDKPFLAFHASGGTTECLLSLPGKDKPLEITTLGKTLDLNAGQIIDRVGLLLGLPFPAGPHLEQLAGGLPPSRKPKAVLKEGDCCLSGLENQCREMVDRKEPTEEIARFCQESVGRSILEMARHTRRQHPSLPFVFAGGVMSNGRIREMIQAELADARFAPPALSADNAVGAAVLAAKAGGS